MFEQTTVESCSVEARAFVDALSAKVRERLTGETLNSE